MRKCPFSQHQKSFQDIDVIINFQDILLLFYHFSYLSNSINITIFYILSFKWIKSLNMFDTLCRYVKFMKKLKIEGVVIKKSLIISLVFSLLISQPVFSIDQEKILQEKYLPLFEEIETVAITKLNHLIDEAYIQYEVKKANNELTLPILFAYIGRGKRLEDEIDEKFQVLLDSMKQEISVNQLSEDITKPFEKQYLKSKQNNKLQLLKNISIEGPTINFEKKH